MPSFEDLKRKAQSAAYTATELAQGAAAAAGEKGEKAGALRDYAEEKTALMSAKRDLAKSYQALGEWYAAQCGDDAPEAVADIVKAIRASRAKIAELRERGADDEK